MRYDPKGSVAYRLSGSTQGVRHRWMQAGFSCAYRSAHLSLPQVFVVLPLSFMFYLA
jgi:hypothetical protein